MQQRRLASWVRRTRKLSVSFVVALIVLAGFATAAHASSWLYADAVGVGQNQYLDGGVAPLWGNQGWGRYGQCIGEYQPYPGAGYYHGQLCGGTVEHDYYATVWLVPRVWSYFCCYNVISGFEWWR